MFPTSENKAIISENAIREATSALSQNRNMLKMQGRSQKKLMTQAMSMEDL